jgi:hypothetical protein
MAARLARSTLILLTILGLLMPRVSAVVALVAPGAETVVICTGSGLQTIVIDSEGKPVPVPLSHQPDHCLLSHVADLGDRATPEPAGAPLVGEVAGLAGDLVRLSDYAGARPPPRAPPSA